MPSFGVMKKSMKNALIIDGLDVRTADELILLVRINLSLVLASRIVVDILCLRYYMVRSNGLQGISDFSFLDIHIFLSYFASTLRAVPLL
jgi:hypothetical protein